MTDTLSERLREVVSFHGHDCPGLTIGYRAAIIALRELGIQRAQDEELVAVCETDACGLDAIQYLTGCTLGKGNLILRDWGKQVFTFGRRSDGKMLRIAARYRPREESEQADPEEARRARIQYLLTAPEEEIFDVRWVEGPMPSRARIFKSIQCSRCGEGVMEARARLQDGLPVCPECYGEPYTRVC